MTTKPQGICENERNTHNRDCIKAIIREAFGVEDVIVGHHLVYVNVEKRIDPDSGIEFDYQVVEEIPAADTLIFDHRIARKIWGPRFKSVLTRLACEPVGKRDALLYRLYHSRKKP